ncbi:cytosolic carboxypeptidase 1-like isoform X3 [Odontomachus brunneus]|nr:cytosolic carboxypeptidase 1-like isoform X3 [Odontomachus brunneus]XP_032686215.1 cytosolic carboxypeptidase 1-like isoform X3 [Odontomachus brunneus]XP_032686216.1 cytosolic carboxypeptidase 1-like isoform X3 [Odontomachus brunneus]XP_032686217.1 cytosolic carboxypeptidase 1-like isoform X3 [Odontomachus brunneus]
MSAGNRSADEAVSDALLEKLRAHAAKPQEAGDAFRAVLAKIHARLTSSDRRMRERTLEKLWHKNSGAMESFIVALENCKDYVADCSIAGILHECISPRASKSKSKKKGSKNKSATRTSSRMAVIQLINLGITQVLVKLLINLQHADTITNEMLTQDILSILGQVAQRDQKFVSKMKLLNSIKVFHTLLRQHYNNSKILLPLLLIIKTLAKNPFSLQILVKDGIASTLEKTFVNVGYTPHLKLRTLLECLKHFTTNKLCCNKLVKVGIVHLLMRIFERWERFDGPMRLKICNYALNTLQHLGVIKAGRKAIKSNNGLQLLYRFCTNCPEDKAYDCLLSRICGIINQCLEKKELPVPEMSPARFVLPEANVRANSAESGSDIDSQANSVASVGRLYSDLDSGDDEEEEEESHDSRSAIDNGIYMSDEVDEGKFFAGVFTSQRSEEDLVGYYTFFRELGGLRSQLRIAGSSAVKLTELGFIEDDQADSQLTKTGKAKTPPKDFTRLNGTAKQQLVTNDKHRLKVLEDASGELTDDRDAYCVVASRVRSVIGFVKVAYPDWIGGDGSGKAEPLNTKDRKVCRAKLLTCVERGLHPSTVQEVVYDLDALASPACRQGRVARLLDNCDEKRLGKRVLDTKQLQFESRFESGNLRKAIQIGLREYDLILTPDVNSGSRHQWFYFEVSNMEANAPYTFNIINCEKANSQFNFGMKPILFSVAEAKCGRPGWVRTGVDICYYRNCYQRPARGGKTYLTTSFTVTFPHAHDVCYLAYHFPYTYSQLMTNIWKWTRKHANSNVYFRAETLCETLNGNENPVLTITSPDSKSNPIHARKVIFLTSRVHPGESNASWVMHGTLKALLSDSQYACSLRDDYVFKIVPMLNIEGVVNGCNRYGLTNEDLNRRWSNPNQVYHPVIYHTKGLMEYCAKVLQRPPHVFVDYHGHSRRKNVFLFGCSRSGSWSAADRAKPDQPVQYLMLPHLMQRTSPAFALPLCSFKVERNKESTARVAVWRQLGVSRSYTMESSFCGCDQGALAGLHLGTEHLKAIGRNFSRALSMMKDAGDDWVVEKSMEQACCPRMCVLRNSRKIPKCIQDKHAIHHTTALP